MGVADKLKESGLILSGLGVIGFLGLVWLMIYGNLSGNLGFSQSVGSGNDTILSDVNVASTLTQVPSANFVAKANNDTWTEYNGVDDEITFNSTNVESVSFWYRNTTTDWQHIVNSSGTIYVNGSVGTQLLYPIYNNNSIIHVGRFDDTNFANVSIDDVRTYSIQISADQVLSIFNGGRA